MLKLFLGSALSELKVTYAKYNYDTYINYNSHKMWNNFLHFLVKTAFLPTTYCYSQSSGSEYNIQAYDCQ